MHTITGLLGWRQVLGLCLSGCFVGAVHAAAPASAPASAPATAPALSPGAARFRPGVFRGANGQTLPYRLMTPEKYQEKYEPPRVVYPLVVFLHGSGERGTDNLASLKNGICEFLGSTSAREKYPCFVLIPQCPRTDSWGMIGYPDTGLSKTTALVLELVAQLREDYSIDGRRMYIGGLSMGGFGTWDVISRYPELFAAAFPICGSGRPEWAAAVKKVPIWAFQGDKDPAVPPALVRQMIAAVQAAGGRPKYSEYPGVGHNSWLNAFAEPELAAWLFDQVRETPGMMRPANLPPAKPPAGWPTTLPSQGTWTGALERMGSNPPRLVVAETRFRLRRADDAPDTVGQELDQVGQGKNPGRCQVTGTAVLEEGRLWILVQSVKPAQD